jgi:hypothetical protein
MTFLATVVLLAFGALNAWSLITGLRLSRRQVAPPEAVRARAAGGIILVLVGLSMVALGTADAVRDWGVLLLIAVLAGAGLFVAGEAIERRRSVDIGRDLGLDLSSTPRRSTRPDRGAINLDGPKATVDLTTDDSRAIRLPSRHNGDSRS